MVVLAEAATRCRFGRRPWRVCCGEADLDAEAAVGGGGGGDGGVVGVGDRLDDGEAETETVRAVGAGGVESLERLEEPVELARRDLRARCSRR